MTPDQMQVFHAGRSPTLAGDEYVCYDVTSVSTWSRMVEEAKYWHDRGHEKLPRTNLGLFHSEESSYPVYLDKHDGFINDYTQVIQACANAKRAGLDGRFKHICDRGFFQRDKLSALVGAGIAVTCGMPAYLEVTKSYIDTLMDEVTKPGNYVGHDSFFAVMVERQEPFRIPCRMLVGFCAESMMPLNADLDARLNEVRDTGHPGDEKVLHGREEAEAHRPVRLRGGRGRRAHVRA